METNHEDRVEVMKVLYNEISQTLRFFVEWRFKLISRFSAIIGGVLVVAGWIKVTGNEYWNRFDFLVFLTASVLSFIFFLLEKRNNKIQMMIVDRGLNIESNMSDISGLFGGLKNEFKETSYSFILRKLYLAMSIVLFLITLYLLYVRIRT